MPRPAAVLPLLAVLGALAPTGVTGSQETTVRLAAVRDRAAEGEEHAETFAYSPPEGFVVAGFRVVERARAGDARYTAELVGPGRLEIAWRTRSEPVRAFGVVIETRPAVLELDLEVALRPASAPPVAAGPPESGPARPARWLLAGALLAAAGIGAWVLRSRRAVADT